MTFSTRSTCNRKQASIKAMQRPTIQQPESGLTSARPTEPHLATCPVLTSNNLGDEFGPTLRLQDGRILEIGANGVTALYTPSANSWAVGPTIKGTINGNSATFGADDAPGAMLPNGHVLFTADAGPATSEDITTGNVTADSPVITNIPSTALAQVGDGVQDADGSETIFQRATTIVSIDSPHQITASSNAAVTETNAGLRFGGTFSAPTEIFDFNPAGAGTITNVTSSFPGDLSQQGAYTTRMTVLPTGQVLFSTSNGPQIYIYTPTTAANPSLRPHHQQHHLQRRRRIHPDRQAARRPISRGLVWG